MLQAKKACSRYRAGDPQPMPLVVARADNGVSFAVLELADFLALARNELRTRMDPDAFTNDVPPTSITGEQLRAQALRNFDYLSRTAPPALEGDDA